jgi:N-acetylneuraminic acid mutarotase
MQPFRATGARKATALCVALYALVAARDVQAQVSEGQGTWIVKTPVPVGRTEVPGVALNGKIHLLGGSARGVAYDMSRNDEYDPTTDRWRARAPMPLGLNHLGAAVVNGKIYTAGGFSERAHGKPHDVFLEYDPTRDTWRMLTPLKSKRGAVAVVGLGSKIHVIGGREGDDPLIKTHEVYDPATGQGMIFVLGAEDGMRTYDENEAYDVKGGRWIKLKSLPLPLHGSAVASVGSTLYSIGGAKKSGSLDVIDLTLAFNLP